MSDTTGKHSSTVHLKAAGAHSDAQPVPWMCELSKKKLMVDNNALYKDSQSENSCLKYVETHKRKTLDIYKFYSSLYDIGLTKEYCP